ncbi:MAG: TonB-dependent receptor, partial [Bacteroidaceae bacterium]|nr:TonB-dependent receptor [Bacteroidaceae bacterium]
TILSKLGTGEDVLAHVPGIIKKRGGFEVFGKGTPLIYINGRLMRDASELDQLKSENIKSIELISTPGAMYDAAVKAVIKIRTKAIQGEGFGFDVRSSYNQRENTNLVEQLNWNYRHNRLDLFGTLYYALSNSNYSSTLNTLVQADTLWQQKYAEVFKPKSQSWHNTIGANYMFNDSNSIGFRYTLKFPLKAYHRGFANSDIIANGEYLDHIDNTVTDTINNRPDHQINMYYMGKIGRAEIEFNTDYLYNKDSSHALYDEQSASQESRLVTSENAKRNELFASKLTVGFPLFGGNLKIGTEYTHTKRNDNYINPEQYVPTSFAELKESHIASFATYSGHIACFQVMAGL